MKETPTKERIHGTKGARLFAVPNWAGIVVAWRDGRSPTIPWGWSMPGGRQRCARCFSKEAALLPQRINGRAVASCYDCSELVARVWEPSP